MTKYELSEGEARLLVAVFDHLKPYYDQAKANGTSVAGEMMNNANEEILETYYELLENALINKLTDREHKIIEQLYGLSKSKELFTLEEIASELDVTIDLIPKRVHQIELEALKKIHQYMTELTDEETDKVVYNLQADAQEHLIDAIRAHKAGNYSLEETYAHYGIVGTDAMNKLKIQQNIRKHREGTE